MSIRKLSFVYLIADFLLIAVSIYLGGLWLLNTQVAFILSMIITFASFFSYKVMIEKRIEAGDKREYRDFYDELDDAYNLYEDKIDSKNRAEEITEKVEKKSSFYRMFANLASSISGALSLYRLLSYLLFVVVILYMIRHEVFSPIAFFVGISVVPIASLIGFLARD